MEGQLLVPGRSLGAACATTTKTATRTKDTQTHSSRFGGIILVLVLVEADPSLLGLLGARSPVNPLTSSHCMSYRWHEAGAELSHYLYMGVLEGQGRLTPQIHMMGERVNCHSKR